MFLPVQDPPPPIIPSPIIILVLLTPNKLRRALRTRLRMSAVHGACTFTGTGRLFGIAAV